MGATNEKSHRILALGASLTQGFTGSFSHFSPYTNILGTLLKKKGINCEIINEGKCGKTTGEILGELQSHLALKPTHVIFLAGTNDVGHGFAADVIFKNIDDIATAFENQGAKVFVMTLPQAGYDRQNENLVAIRDKVNAMIKERFKDSAIDMNTLNPYYGIDEEERKRLWFDWIHYSAAGYEKMGRIVFEHIQDKL